MIVANYSITTKTAKLDIWPFYANLNAWPQWDEDIEYARLEGNEFTQGAKGIIKPVGGPKIKFELSEVITDKSFTVTSYLPLTKMIFAHYLNDNPDGTITITHQVEMIGITSPIFAFIIGRKIKANLPDAMNKLVKLAESNSSEGSLQ
ncbi:MAG: hypothetical protein P0S93_06075 [Candidatus Neptunochlamydia sp.]|nr:hypothetical protein [Candidatus Neptunochlamydia sp.]